MNMGTYLSTPVTDKHEEYGESFEYIPVDMSITVSSNSSDNDSTNNTPTPTNVPIKAIPYVHWGVVEMQGWRKSMEDAHVTQTNVSLFLLPHTHINSSDITSSSGGVSSSSSGNG